MGTLFVRLDHVAALRQAGGTRDPDPVVAGALAELAGAGGISIGVGRERPSSRALRQDFGELSRAAQGFVVSAQPNGPESRGTRDRGTQAEGDGAHERDLRLLKETVRTALNVCLPPQEEWVKLVLAIRPDLATLTPAGREGSGAELVLDVEDRRSELQPVIETLKSGRIAASLMVDPAPAQVKAAHRAGAAAVLLHTGRFCWAEDGAARGAEFERLVNAAKIAVKLGLAVHAGGGLSYQTVSQLAEIREIGAIHVGHSLIARASLVGMGEAVRELLRMLAGAGGRE